MQGFSPRYPAAGLAGVLLLVTGGCGTFFTDSVIEPYKEERCERLGDTEMVNGVRVFSEMWPSRNVQYATRGPFSLAITFNDLAGQVREEVQGLGLLLALLILALGHALNFALALMSGVVHGLRLNYIEFFKWALSEEGVAFRPFARKEVKE